VDDDDVAAAAAAAAAAASSCSAKLASWRNGASNVCVNACVCVWTAAALRAAAAAARLCAVSPAAAAAAAAAAASSPLQATTAPHRVECKRGLRVVQPTEETTGDAGGGVGGISGRDARGAVCGVWRGGGGVRVRVGVRVCVRAQQGARGLTEDVLVHVAWDDATLHLHPHHPIGTV